jgi:hypothetical protein
MNPQLETDIFEPALNSLKDIGIFGPKSFKEYAKEHHFDSVRTAELISVDFYERLQKSLRQNDAMVFRLGRSSDGKTTNFVIIKIKNHLRDFFFFDNEIFSAANSTTFLPITSMRKFYQFLILPELSESSFINLGLASGLIGDALGLDEPESMIIPATCRSSFTFEFVPHSLNPVHLKHENGQVEIDSIFIARREGRDCLFLIEAKSSFKRESFNSLAKHKLVYPLMALYPKMPEDMSIIPVYIKVKKVENGVTFDIAECDFPDPRIELAPIDKMKVKQHMRYYLPVNFR